MAITLVPHRQSEWSGEDWSVEPGCVCSWSMMSGSVAGVQVDWQQEGTEIHSQTNTHIQRERERTNKRPTGDARKG